MILWNCAAGLRSMAADRFDARRDFLWRHRRNEPPVRQLSHTPERRFAAAADPNRRASFLIRARKQRQIMSRIELSVEGDFLLTPQFLHQNDGFVGSFSAFLFTNADRGKIFGIISAQPD